MKRKRMIIALVLLVLTLSVSFAVVKNAIFNLDYLAYGDLTTVNFYANDVYPDPELIVRIDDAEELQNLKNAFFNKFTFTPFAYTLEGGFARAEFVFEKKTVNFEIVGGDRDTNTARYIKYAEKRKSYYLSTKDIELIQRILDSGE